MTYDPERIGALIAERDRLRLEIDRAVTKDAEWEAVVGMPLAQAMADAHARYDANAPYALTEALDELRTAFRKVAEDRNMWRARAKRARADGRGGEE